MTGASGGLGGIFPLLQSLTAAEIARAFGQGSGFGDVQGAPLGANRLNPQTPNDGQTQGNGRDAPADHSQGQAPRNTPNTALTQQALAQQALAQAQGQGIAGGSEQGQGGGMVSPALQGGGIFGADLDVALPMPLDGGAGRGLGLGAGATGRETPWSNWLMGLGAPMSAIGKGAALLADGQLQQAARRGGDAAASPPVAQGSAAAQGAVAQAGNAGSGLGLALMTAALGAEGAAATDTQDDGGAAQTAARAAQGSGGASVAQKPQVQTGMTQALLTAVEIQAIADGADVSPAPKSGGVLGQIGAQMPSGVQGAQAGQVPLSQAALTAGASPAAVLLARETTGPSELRSTAPQGAEGASPARAALPDLPAGASIRAALTLALGDIAGATGFPLTADTKGGGAAAMVIFNAAMIPQWPPAFKAQGAMADANALQVAGAQLAQMSPEEAAEYLAKMASAFGFLLTVKKRLSKTLKEEKESLLGMFSFLGVALDTLVKGLQTALDLTVEQQAMLEEVLTEGKGRGAKSRQRLRL